MGNDRNVHDTGRNLGQGVAGVNDDERRDLMNRGGDQRTKDQQHVRSSDANREARQGREDRSSAPE